MMSLPNASITSIYFCHTYSSTKTRLKLKTEFEYCNIHIFCSLFPKSLITIACVIFLHSSSYHPRYSDIARCARAIKTSSVPSLPIRVAPAMVVSLLCTNDPSHTWNISSARLYMWIKLCSV